MGDLLSPVRKIFIERPVMTLSVLKLVSAIFYQIFIFHQMIALQKLGKIFFISSKSSFRSQDIHVFVFRSSLLFFLSAIALEVDPRKILKILK